MGSTSRQTAGENVKAACKDFLKNTSMHGLKYVGEENRHVVERVLWVFMFGVGVGISVYFCCGMMNKYYTSPAVMSIESTDKKLLDFPFPSVTVCSQNKISKTKFERLMNNSRYGRTFSHQEMMTIMLVLMKMDTAANYGKQLSAAQSRLNSASITMSELINVTIQALVSCDDILMDCQWLNRPTPCMELFEMIPTDDGLCCGFNPIQSGWAQGKQEYNELKRVHLPGYRIGLIVALDADLKEYTVTTGRSNGFKVLLHHPPEFPSVGERGFLISPGYEVCSGLNPMMSYNTAEVDSLDLAQRSCYMKSENPLSYYANYSVSTCHNECLVRQMMANCSCRPFQFAANAPDAICQLDQYACLSNVFVSFRDTASVTAKQCGSQQIECYPKCNDVWYFNDLSMAPFPGELFLESRTGERIMAKKNANMTKAQFKEYMASNVALFNVFYKEMTGYEYRKDVRYGTDDFISSIGGLLGLGFGFSVISAVEIVYFFGIRWIFTGRRSRHERRKVQPVQHGHPLSVGTLPVICQNNMSLTTTAKFAGNNVFFGQTNHANHSTNVSKLTSASNRVAPTK